MHMNMTKPQEPIREKLIDHGIELALSHEDGLAAVTVQAVIAAAETTKESFAQNFPDRQSLIDAIFSKLMASIDREIDDAIANDSETYGSFTRAFIMCVLDMDWNGRWSPQGPLSALILTDARLKTIWSEWYRQRDMRHQATDGDVLLDIIRISTRGIWLAGAAGIDIPEKNALREKFLEYTKTAYCITRPETSFTAWQSTLQ